MGMLEETWLYLKKNRFLLGAVLFLPGLQILFAAADLNAAQLLTVGGCAFFPTIVLQAWKVLREIRRRGLHRG